MSKRARTEKSTVSRTVQHLYRHSTPHFSAYTGIGNSVDVTALVPVETSDGTTKLVLSHSLVVELLDLLTAVVDHEPDAAEPGAVDPAVDSEPASPVLDPQSLKGLIDEALARRLDAMGKK